ncbi:MAG: adenylate/guanylate cyclase domain-containing protein [Hyphomicrobiales bacterium]
MTTYFTAQKLRLYSGLVLFAFVLTHFLNHALGLVSWEVMETVQYYRTAITRSLPITALLCTAIIVHVVLALYKTAKRRSLRMSAWEAVQLIFGLAIPFLLLRHVIGTRLIHELYDVQDKYSFVLWVMWPGEAINQLILVPLVWIHACIGIHFWLRMKPWYPRIQYVFLGIAVLVPSLAYAGFTVAARDVKESVEFTRPFTPEQFAFVLKLMDWAFWAAVMVVGALILFRVCRAIFTKIRRNIKISYVGGTDVTTTIGPSLLEISRSWGVPHASVCGGRARCSTCRVRVLEGLEYIDPPEEQESAVLKRVGAGEAVRLACQMHPKSDITIATLLPAQRVKPGDAADHDEYTWGKEQTVTVMFADLRGFTAMSEERLPYDVVFLLNQYLGQMSTAIEDAGGYVDKFIGDGIMALFGINSSPEEGAKDALRAARAMGGVLDGLNKGLASDLPKPLNIGIGLHTGPAILGRVGISNPQGASQRITALGDTVNTSSRLESSSKELGAQLVISITTIQAAGIEVSEDSMDEITVKGKINAIQVAKFTRALNAPFVERV